MFMCVQSVCWVFIIYFLLLQCKLQEGRIFIFCVFSTMSLAPTTVPGREELQQVFVD